jgi:hypothetical protein
MRIARDADDDERDERDERIRGNAATRDDDERDAERIFGMRRLNRGLLT